MILRPLDRLPDRPGIYLLRNRLDWKVYVGSASKSIRSRVRLHVCGLIRGDHDNSYLQRAWDKYGRDAFEFGILRFCPAEECVASEQEWMDRLRAAERRYGYNLAPTAGSMLGFRHTAEMCKRQSERMRRIMATPEVRAKVAGNGERSRDPAVRAKIAASVKALQNDPEYVARMKASRSTPEYREGLVARNKERWKREGEKEAARETMLAYWSDPEWKEKVRAAMRGRKCSEEAKARMRAAKAALLTDPVRKAIMLEKRRLSREANKAAMAAGGG